MSSNLDVEHISPIWMVGDSQCLDKGSEDLHSHNITKANTIFPVYLSQFFAVVEAYHTILPSETQMA